VGGIKSDHGEHLRQEHDIPAFQVYYHLEGTFFMPLHKFPGALADKHGYVIFATEEEFLKCGDLDHGGSSKNPRVHVCLGISRMHQYIKFMK